MSKKVFLTLILTTIMLIAGVIFVLKLNKVDNSGWIVETEELKELQNKYKKNGYLTKEDLQELDRIHNEQFERLREKNRRQTKTNSN